MLTYPRQIEKEGTRCSPLFPDPCRACTVGRTPQSTPLSLSTPLRYAADPASARTHAGLAPGAIAAPEARDRLSREHIRARGCHRAASARKGILLLDFLPAIAQGSSGQSHRSRPAKILDRRPGFRLSSAAVCQAQKMYRTKAY